MNDYTAAVIRLENAYSSMQIARKRVADEVKAEFQRAIRDEISRRQYEIEHDFAKALRLETERGLPGAVIRAEVLRTQDWGRWKKWRDMADIEPERVTRSNAREENRLASLTYRWDEADTAFGYALVLLKDEQGNRIEPEAVLTDIKYTAQDKLTVMPNVFGDNSHRAVWEKHWNGNGQDMQKYATRVANEHRKEIGK